MDDSILSPRYDGFKITPVDLPSGPTQGNWTYDDYCQIPEDGNRYEVIAGVLYTVPFVRTCVHQEVVGLIGCHFMTYIRIPELGRVYFVPVDVKLEEKTVVQPDVAVLLRENPYKIIYGQALGIPDLVVEVASPPTTYYDRHQKYQAYELAGIKEYWLVEPKQQSVEVLFLKEGRYQSQGIFRGQEKLPTRLIENFPMQAGQCFGKLESGRD